MAITFNADEAFAMAEEIERNGRKFYLRAAEIVKEGPTNKLLLDLAAWEESHEKLFTSMRTELTEQEKTDMAIDPDGQAELYLRAMADTHVFNVNDDLVAGLSGDESHEEILNIALDFERDSILFFLGLKEVVPARLGSDKVDKIIHEEVGHVAYLKKQLD